MPELPDITVYANALGARVVGTALTRVDVFSPSLLKTFEPPLATCAGRTVQGVSRLGKRIVIELEGGVFIVVHLMVSGRFVWSQGKPKTRRPQGKAGLAVFHFETGHLVLTEAATQHRAGVWVVAGQDALNALDPGGIDVLSCSPEEFGRVLRSSNRTVKRALTDPRSFSGIGNSYSDEIIHAARMSPFKTTAGMTDEEVSRLHASATTVLTEWTDRLAREFGDKFPARAQITAFRPDFAVHGKYGSPCPVCGAPVQHIVYSDNETNYCPACQTGGKLLADRAMSRLLKADWPSTLEELMAE